MEHAERKPPINSKPNSKRKRPTRQEQLTNLLRRKSGATLKQLETAFGWQPHTARAAISTLRKSGLHIERTTSKSGSVYQIVEEV